MDGLIHIYCGDGKGKTTAAVGLAVRASGAGLRVLFLQFLKSGQSSELQAFSEMSNITVLQEARPTKFTCNMSDDEKQDAREIYKRDFEVMKDLCREYNLLVMDELLDAVSCGFLDAQQVVDFLKNKPRQLEVVLTGRKADEETEHLADYITEMKKIKHPYDEGAAARAGIEF